MQSDTSQLRTPFFVQVNTANSVIGVSWCIWNARSGAKPCVFTAGPLCQKDQNSDVWKLIRFPSGEKTMCYLGELLAYALKK